MPGLTVSKLADQVGMTPDALRYYEHTGLLPTPERTASGYRLYDEETADRLRFIKGARSGSASGSVRSASFSKCSTVACALAAIPRRC
jgi:DNA-binding transcriptional MerR regulator